MVALSSAMMYSPSRRKEESREVLEEVPGFSKTVRSQVTHQTNEQIFESKKKVDTLAGLHLTGFKQQEKARL